MELRQGIIDTANALGVSPIDLATVISYETGGTFDPAQPGPTTQFGQHRGLIQFGEPQAKQHGVDWSNPAASQLGPNGAIASYMRGAGVRPGMGLLDIYSAVNAGRVGRYNASDANNGGAPGTVADKVNYQMDGHRKKAAALLGGGFDVAQDTMKALGRGPQMTPQPMSQPTTSTRGAPQAPPAPEDEKLLGGFLSRDKRDYLIMALEGMTLNPNRALMAQAAGNIKDRREDRRDAKQRNKTAEWLRSQGREDLASAVEGGSVPATFAVQAALAPAKDDRTAMMKNYEFLIAKGYPAEDAMAMARGGQTINVNTGQDGINYGDPGDGLVWQRDQEGNVVVDDRGAPVAIPYQGGKAWREQQENTQESAGTRAKTTEQDRQTKIRMGATLENLNLNIAEIENGGVPVTGVVGALGSYIPGTPQSDFAGRNVQITTRAALDEIQNMRRNNPTGGAVGQLTDSEREAIGIAATSLFEGASAGEYLRAAKNFRKTMLDIAFGEGNWKLSNSGNEVIVTGNSKPATGSKPPAGVSQEEWDVMTDEEKSLWRN